MRERAAPPASIRRPAEATSFGEHGDEQRTLLKESVRVRSRTPPNSVRHCSLFGKNVRLYSEPYKTFPGPDTTDAYEVLVRAPEGLLHGAILLRRADAAAISLLAPSGNGHYSSVWWDVR